MSDLNERLRIYKAQIGQGASEVVARRMARLSKDEALQAHASYDSSDIDYAGGAHNLDLAKSVADDPNTGLAVKQLTPSDPDGLYKADNEDESAWWKRALGTAGSAWTGFVGAMNAAHQGVVKRLAYIGHDELKDDVEAAAEGRFLTLFDALDMNPSFDEYVISRDEFDKAFENSGTALRNTAGGAYLGTTLVADIAIDPLTYATGVGIGTKAANFMRKVAPIRIQAEAAVKLAAHTGHVDDLMDAQTKLGALKDSIRKGVDKGKFTEAKGLEMLEQADKSKKYIDYELGLRTEVDEAISKVGKGDSTILADQVPHQRPDNIIIPDDASKLTKKTLEARKEALKEWPESVRPRKDTDVDALYARAVEGPDAAQHAAETAGRIATGADAADDLAYHTSYKLNGTKHSTNILPDGVGVDGRVLQTRKLVDDATGELTKIQDDFLTRADDLAAQQKSLKESIKESGQGGFTDPGNATKKQMLKEAEEDLAKMTKGIDEISGQIAEIRKTGKLPKDFGEYNVKWPSGPRRELLDSADFVKNEFGRDWPTVLRKGLFPKSYHIRPMWMMKVDQIFGETWRTLDKYAPKVAKRVFGGMRDAEITNSRHNVLLGKIFQKAGIYGEIPPSGILDSSGVGGLAKRMTLNRKKSGQLFDMLDSKAGSAERLAAEKAATPELVEAAGAIRVLLSETADDLGLVGADRIDDYIHHMLKWDHFKGGNVPVMFQGTSVKQKLPGFLKERTRDKATMNRDAVEVLDYYFRGVAHELHMRPMIQDIRLGLKESIEMSDNPKAMEWLAGYGDSISDRIMGKPSLGRQFLRFLEARGLAGAGTGKVISNGAMMSALTAYSSVLSGSVRYFVMSVAQAINSTVPAFGLGNTLRSLAKMTTPSGRMIAKATGVADEAPKMFEGITQVMGDLATQFRLGPVPSIRDAEGFIRGVSMDASITSQLTKLGVGALDELTPNMANEVVAMAMRDTRNINHVFGFLGKPIWFNQASVSGSTVATQFTSFPFKQMGTMFDKSMENPGYFVDYFLATGFLSKMADKLGVDLDRYIGSPVKELRDVTGVVDQNRIPVEFGVSTLNYISKTLNPFALHSEKLRAKEDFMKAADKMTPFLTAAQRWSDVVDLASGKPVEVREDKGGALGRLVNKAVSGEIRHPLDVLAASRDREGPLIRSKETDILPANAKSTSVFAIMSHMNDVEGRIHQKQDKAVRRHEDKRIALTTKLADEISDAATAGEPVDMNKVREIAIELNRVGFKISMSYLAQMAQDKHAAQELPILVRNALRNKRLYPVQKEAEQLERARQ